MDVYNALESRIERLIAAFREAQRRVAALEEENAALRSGAVGLETLQQRVATLEAERDEVRGRLEKLLVSLQELDL